MFAFLLRFFGINKRIDSLNDSSDIGTFGEDLAVRFLKKNGFRIIDRNWRYKQYEIDIICRDGDKLVFVEVKTRASDSFTRGYLSVNKNKKRALAHACRAYLNSLTSYPHTYRLDIIEVTLDKKENSSEISHIENIAIIDKN